MSIELQLMRKFSKDQAVSNLKFPEEFKGEFQPLLEKLKDDDNSNILHVNRGNVLRLLTLCDGAVDTILG